MARSPGSRVPAPKVRSARRAVDRALRLTALAWAGAWLVASVFGIASVGGSVPARLALLAGPVAGLAAYAAGWLGAPWMVAAFAGGALAQLLAVLPQSATSFPAFLILSNLTVILAGMLLPWRAAVATTAASSATQLAITAGASAASGALADVWAPVLVVSAYTVADGMATAGAVGALRRAARATDDMVARQASATAAAAAARARHAEVRRIATVLHDTVVNTLGALARHGGGTSGRVRERCAQDLAELARVRPAATAVEGAWPPALPSPTVGALADHLRARAEVLGLRCRVRVGGAARTLPPEVAEALAGAAGEAMVNVAKHAGRADVGLRVRGRAGRATVAVVDRGPGFADCPPERGLDASVRHRGDDLGARARVVSRPGTGTAVLLGWRGRPAGRDAPAPPDAAAEFGPGMRRGIGTAAGWLLGMAALQVAVAPPEIRAESLLALVLAAASTFALLRGHSRAGRVRGWPAGLAVAVLPAVVWLPGRGAPGCEAFGLPWWGPDAGIALVLVAVLLGAGRLVRWALGVGFLGSAVVVLANGAAQGCGVGGAGVVVADAGLVVCFVLLRRMLDRFWEQARAAQRQAEELGRATAAARARDGVRRRWLGVAAAPAERILTGIASGRLDPADPPVAARCAEAEGLLRSLIAVDPRSGEAADALVERVMRERRAGRMLRVRASGTSPPTPAPARTGQFLHAVFGALLDPLPPAATTTVTLLDGGAAGEGGGAVRTSLVVLTEAVPAMPLPRCPPGVQLEVAEGAVTVSW